jgi:ribonuclease HI
VPWRTYFLRGARVFVKVAADGRPLAGSDGRVDVRYQPGGKVYRASLRNLEPDPAPETREDATVGEAPGPAVTMPGKKGARRSPGGVPDGAIEVWTDGACTGNPGPMGLGVVIIDGKERRELSEYLGEGTNNIAELTAIQRALESCPRDRTVVVHADSAYAIGLLAQGWKAKANQALVAELRELASQFADLRLVKVEGHAGVSENERADELAREAIRRGR